MEDRRLEEEKEGYGPIIEDLSRMPSYFEFSSSSPND
jgi:hypothetical protein